MPTRDAREALRGWIHMCGSIRGRRVGVCNPNASGEVAAGNRGTPHPPSPVSAIGGMVRKLPERNHVEELERRVTGDGHSTDNEDSTGLVGAQSMARIGNIGVECNH